MNILKKCFFKEIAILTGFLLIAILVYSISIKFSFFKSLYSQDLSTTTKSLLANIHQPLTIQLASNNPELANQVKLLVRRYQQYQPLIIFSSEKNILNEPHSPQHALLISYQNCREILDLNIISPNEHHLTQALFKLQRKPNQWVVFLQGHDEPDPYGTQNTDISLFRQSLENQGFKIQKLNLTTTPFIPDNTSVLIINSVKSALLPKEQSLIDDYIAKGKDLLWLMDPASLPVASLSQTLGVFAHPGIIIDAHGQRLGTPHPAITLIEHYPTLPFQAPKTLTAFPFALALDVINHPDFQSKPMLVTNESTWTETSALNGNISFDPEKNEIAGPLLLGVNLIRQYSNTEQRITVIGNSRFLSNGAIENYGNLALGLNLLNWLNHDDALIQIEQPIVKDSVSQIHLQSALLIQYVYPLLSALLVIFPMFFFLLRQRKSRKISTQISRSH